MLSGRVVSFSAVHVFLG